MHAISNLPTQRASPCEELTHRSSAFFETKRRRRGAGDDDNVRVVRQLGAVKPIQFPQQPLYPVANNRTPYFLRYGETELPSLSFPPGNVANKVTSDLLVPTTVYGKKFGSSGEPFLAGKAIDARHNRVIPSSLCRKPFPAFCPAAANYISPARRCHARPEPMVPLAFN